jgi:hypothetical protein
MVNRISKPGDGELELPLAGFKILGILRIPWLNPVT